MDDCSTTPNHILCRDGTFCEPVDGWGRTDRVYFVLKTDQNTNRRLGQFESYRTEIEKNRNSSNYQRRRQSVGNQRSSKTSYEESNGVKLHIGRGEFKNGSFKKLTASSAVGGIVIVGPFPKDSHCVHEIRDEAFKKFQTLLRQFRKQFQSPEQMTLVYPDGSVVENLPDGSAKFTIRGYRDYLDPNRKYERLRLYLVETAQIEDEIEIVSESSSSDSLPDPFEEEKMPLGEILNQGERNFPLQMETDHSSTELECNVDAAFISPQSGTIDLTDDDTLPIDIKIRFTFSDNTILTGRFEQSAEVATLANYVYESGVYRDRNVQLLFHGEIMDFSRKLYSFNLQPNRIMEIELKPLAEPTDRVFAHLGRRRHRLSLRRLSPEQIDSPQQTQASTSATSQADDNLQASTSATGIADNNLNVTEIMQIVKDHANQVLEPTPTQDECWFQNINVSRYYVLEDFLEYVEDENYVMNKKMKIHFVSTFGEHDDLEIAIDEGGPRREFFRILIEALVLTSGLLEGPETKKVFSSKVSALRSKKYYYAGYAVAASLLMGGQPLCCLAPSIVDFIMQQTPTPTVEEITDFELREALRELKDVDSTESLRLVVDEKLDMRFSLGVDKPTCLLHLQDKEEIINDICMSYVIHRTTPAIHQFMEGLESLKVLTLFRRHPGLRTLLEDSERFDVTPTKFKESLEFDYTDRGSNRRPIEERLAKRLIDYIDDIFKSPRHRDEHEVTLQSLFAFITGLTKFPPTGLNKIQVSFDHEAMNESLPSANTCGCILFLPVYEALKDKEKFNTKFDTAILYAGGMHAL